MSNLSRFQSHALAALIGASLAVAGGSPDAWACRGTSEYPAVSARLAATPLPADQKAALTQQLEAGQTLHDGAHRRNDTEAMQASLKILDRIKAALPR